MVVMVERSMFVSETTTCNQIAYNLKIKLYLYIFLYFYHNDEVIFKIIFLKKT